MAHLLAGWDFARYETAPAFTIDDDGAAHLITFSTGTYCHIDLQSVLGTGAYDDFATALQTAINAVVDGSNTYAVTFVTSPTPGYLIEADTVNFSLAFSGDAGTNMRRILGLSGNQSGASEYSSDVTAYYYLALARDGYSDFSRPFETAGQTKRVVSSNASAYSVGPQTYEERLKLKMRFNALASVFEDQAVTAAPWTYEALRKHVRCHQPVVFRTTTPAANLVCKFVTGEFDEGSRKSVFRDYHAKWDLEVEAQYLGSV